MNPTPQDPMTPDQIPPFTEEMIAADYVLLGRGGTFKVPENRHGEQVFEGAAFDIRNPGRGWEIEDYKGTVKDFLYAAPANSEVVRINGHGAVEKSAEGDAKTRADKKIEDWQIIHSARYILEDANPEKLADCLGLPIGVISAALRIILSDDAEKDFGIIPTTTPPVMDHWKDMEIARLREENERLSRSIETLDAACLEKDVAILKSLEANREQREALESLMNEYNDREAQFGESRLWVKHEDAEILDRARKTINKYKP